MTPEQINVLAREYAVGVTKDMAKNLDESSCLLNETIIQTTEYCSDFLQWLLKRFCIVEKSDIKEWVNTVAEVVPYPENIALKIGAERLFGKELFKDKEE